MSDKRAVTDSEKEEVINKLLEQWKKAPSLRFAQLIDNAVYQSGKDLFYVEDYELVDIIYNFVEQANG
jgi:hypothetical protein